MKVSLINCSSEHPDYRLFLKIPPLGLLSIAGGIRDVVDEINIIDLTIENLDYNKIGDSDIVGISTLTASSHQALDIAKKIKQINSNIKIVVGGWHPSLYSNDFRNNSCVDHILIGEGEIAFKKIVEDKIHKKIIRGNVKDIDSLPLPAYDLIDRSKYHLFNLKNLISLESSRGCPFSCKFCCIRKFYNNMYKLKTIKKMIKEITEFDANTIFFTDDNFTANVKRTKELCNAIIDHGLENKLYACQSRIDTLARNPELLKYMSEAGFIGMFLGIESLSNKSLEEMNKRMNTDIIKKGIKLLHDHNLFAYGTFIIGNLNETESDINKMLDKINELDLDFVTFSILTPFKDTELYKQLKKENRIITEDTRYYTGSFCVFKHPNINPMRLNKIFVESYLKVYYNPFASFRRLKNITKKYINRFGDINKSLDHFGFFNMLIKINKFLLFEFKNCWNEGEQYLESDGN